MTTASLYKRTLYVLLIAAIMLIGYTAVSANQASAEQQTADIEEIAQSSTETENRKMSLSHLIAMTGLYLATLSGAFLIFQVFAYSFIDMQTS